MNTHTAEERLQVLKGGTQATANQRLHTLGIKGVPGIIDTEEYCQECNSDPVMDRQKPLPSENLVRYHHKTGFLPR